MDGKKKLSHEALGCMIMPFVAVFIGWGFWQITTSEMRHPARIAAEEEARNPQLTEARTAYITKDSFGEGWPLTVNYVTLRCRTKGDIKIVTALDPSGKEYALNGSASNQGFPSLEPIWALDPSIPGARRTISSLISKGASLC